MFLEIINTICVFFSVSLLFLGATTHKCVKQVEEKIDLVINEINELDSDSVINEIELDSDFNEINDLDSDSDSDSDLDSDSDSYSDPYSDSYSDSDMDIIPKYDETFRFEPFIEKSSSLPDFQDDLNLKKNMSF